MELEEVRPLESHKALTSSAARTGPLDPIEDVHSLEESFIGNFPSKRSSPKRGPPLILTALVSLAVALSIAFLLQKCSYGLGQGVATQGSGIILTRRGNARRLSDSNPSLCYPAVEAPGEASGQQITPQEGGQEGSLGAAGGRPGSPQAPGPLPEGASLSGIEARAWGSSSRSRTAEGLEAEHPLVRGVRRALGYFARMLRGNGGSDSEDPLFGDEAVLVAIRKKASDEGGQTDSSLSGRPRGAEAEASSASEPGAEGTQGQQPSTPKQLTSTDLYVFRHLSGRKALSRKAGRKVSRLLAHIESDLAILEHIEESDAAQPSEPTDEERSSTSSEGEGAAAEASGPQGSWEHEQLIAFLAKGHSSAFVKIAKKRRTMQIERQVDLEAQRIARLTQEAARRGSLFFRWWMLEPGDDDVFE
ncbi:hypothetical protein ACSSS7_004821 [Eimeria intestinalis]